MKKILLSLVSLAMAVLLIVTPSEVSAINFEGKEDKYRKLCSSENLTNSLEKTCRDFNDYLSEKNKELKDEIKEEEKNIDEATAEIVKIQNKLDSIQAKIADKKEEINYIESSIKKTEKIIKEKDEEMRDRLYIMQSDYNSNFFISFLFGADNFSDFFSRINSLNDITAYEKELIAELNKEKEELDKKKETLENAKAKLEKEKKEAEALENQLKDMKEEAQAQINSNKNDIKENEATQKEIDEALEEMLNSIPEQDTGGTVIKGDSATGNRIAEIAISRLGSPYWWGATGPNYFDCSGLVYYCLKQAGISGGRGTAHSYANSGKAISYNQLQAGDVVCFRRSGSSRYHHIGIYIGNNVVVHASGEGSTCVGNHASKGHVVKRTSLSSFSKYIKTYRRLY